MKSVRKRFSKVHWRDQTNIHKHVENNMFKVRKITKPVNWMICWSLGSHLWTRCKNNEGSMCICSNMNRNAESEASHAYLRFLFKKNLIKINKENLFSFYTYAGKNKTNYDDRKFNVFFFYLHILLKCIINRNQ